MLEADQASVGGGPPGILPLRHLIGLESPLLSYIRELTGRVGLTELSVEEQVLRQDKRAPVNGFICVLGKAGS